MWNRRKEEENNPKPAHMPTTGPAPAATPMQPKESTAISPPMTMRSYDTNASGGSATIGKAVMIKGQIFSREDLIIDGEMEGSVEAQDHRVTIGPNGKVHAGVKAREIVILGAIQGNVEATEKIDIRRDARLVGDIKTARIVIEDGAYFKGSIDITKGEQKPQPKVAERPIVREAPTVAPNAS
jgi:cytoskeletal protein CcmA (bactofilin family)